MLFKRVLGRIKRKTWRPIFSDAVAVWSKRDQMLDEIYFQGTVEACGTSLRFVPADKRLRTVEVSL